MDTASMQHAIGRMNNTQKLSVFLHTTALRRLA